MDAYLEAKALLIALLTPDGAAVVNADDPAWRALPNARRTVRFGAEAGADVRAEGISYTPRGSTWTLAIGTERHPVRLPLIGDFNVANALAAAAAAWAMRMTPAAIAEKLTTMPQVPGRLEIINEGPTVLRDYAHTPDALERALSAVRPFTSGSLVCVFGCGGDRDRGKRPEMGRIAEAGADRAIVTSDNPRTEDPEAILDDIEAGMSRGNHERIEDRRAAIARAVRSAQEGDVVLLAGKGHETYQIRGTVKYPFDERAIVREIISEEVT
jgi:UDP-N-acetylmuramoyl-L-alanyl-D-glutamate--2,6-diaminopimelate ligase